MKKLLAVLSVGALAAVVAPTSAHAQSLNDIPEVGPQICTEWQNQLDAFEGQAQDAGTPFAELHAGAQELHDAACGGGEEEPPAEEPDDGGDDANPLCGPLEQIAGGIEENGGPAEFADGLRQIAAAMGCPAPEGGDEPPPDEGDEPGPHCQIFTEIIAGMEENGAPAELIDGFQQIADGAGCAAEETPEPTTTTTAPAGDDDDDDDTEVAGETEAAQTGGGTATPATGGGLLAGGIGLGLVGLATAGRRFFGSA